MRNGGPLIEAKMPPTNGPGMRKKARAIAKHLDVPTSAVRELFRDIRRNERVFINDVYQVNVREVEADVPGGAMIWLSIKRHDKAPVSDWRDMQDMKNELVGEECEGAQLFPAESRLIDTANQFHVWCLPHPGFRFPFGFHEGRHVHGGSIAGAIQRDPK